MGGDHALVPGGKGANQAVAAARLGATVSFVGRVGSDSAGVALRESLDAAGVDTAFLRDDPDAPSGIALIGVDADGDNAIVVSPGTNARVGPEDVQDAKATIAGAAVVLLQLEVPTGAVVAAARAATGTVVLNPAPATPLPDGLLDRVDVLVPNALELAQLADAQPDATVDALVAMARSLFLSLFVLVGLGCPAEPDPPPVGEPPVATYEEPVPIEVDEKSPAFKKLLEVLRHEYVHLLIVELAAECPMWLNEGIAQYFEASYTRDAVYSRLKDSKEIRIPLKKMPARLGKIDDVALARWVYLQGLGFVEFLAEKYKPFRLRLLLRAIAEEHSAAAAFERVYGRSTGELEKEWWERVENPAG